MRRSKIQTTSDRTDALDTRRSQTKASNKTKDNRRLSTDRFVSDLFSLSSRVDRFHKRPPWQRVWTCEDNLVDICFCPSIVLWNLWSASFVCNSNAVAMVSRTESRPVARVWVDSNAISTWIRLQCRVDSDSLVDWNADPEMGVDHFMNPFRRVFDSTLNNAR